MFCQVRLRQKQLPKSTGMPTNDLISRISLFLTCFIIKAITFTCPKLIAKLRLLKQGGVFGGKAQLCWLLNRNNYFEDILGIIITCFVVGELRNCLNCSTFQSNNMILRCTALVLSLILTTQSGWFYCKKILVGQIFCSGNFRVTFENFCNRLK